jgi:hypothetical protein
MHPQTSKKIGAMIAASSPAELAALQSELPVLSLLAKLDPGAASLLPEAPADQAGQQRVSLVVKEGLQVGGWEHRGGGSNNTVASESIGLPLAGHGLGSCVLFQVRRGTDISDANAGIRGGPWQTHIYTLYGILLVPDGHPVVSIQCFNGIHAYSTCT